MISVFVFQPLVISVILMRSILKLRKMAKKHDQQIDDYYLTAQLFLNKDHLADVDLKQLATLHETPTVNEHTDGSNVLANTIDVQEI